MKLWNYDFSTAMLQCSFTRGYTLQSNKNWMFPSKLFRLGYFSASKKGGSPPISQPLLLLPTKKESLCCLFGSPIFQSSPTDWITDLTCVLPLPDSYLHRRLTKLFLWGGSSPRHGRRLCPEVFQNLQGGHATEVSLQWSNIQKALEALKQTNEV